MKNTIEIYNHQCTRRDLLLLICTCFLSSLAQGEVTLDGSVGPTGALTGPDYKVTENVGKRAGSNLFHSFGRFNLNASESATFSGSTGIKNVISRVTGGQTSNIDGTLRVSIPKANMYLLNPAGVIFGEHAKLDVPGSFHVSTADYLKFQDGVHFDSGTATTPQVLATAAPEAFGFLGENPAGITLTGGTDSVLEVKQGSTISLIGGDITSDNTAIYAPGGRINLASVGSAGEVSFNESGIQTSSFERMGDIRISQDPLIARAPRKAGFVLANIDASDDTAGKIFIRGGQLVMNNSFIDSNTTNGDSGDIRIGLTGGLNLSAPPKTLEGSFTGSEIASTTQGEGNAGSITLDIAELNLDNRTQINTSAVTTSTGNAGDLTINANTIQLQNGDPDTTTRLITASYGDGDAGNIAITTNNTLEVRGEALIDSSTNSKGEGGDLTINTDNLKVLNGGRIINNTGTEATGKGGNLTIDADNIFLLGTHIQDGDSGTITALTTTSFGDGDAGNLAITTDTLEMRGKALLIDSSTQNKGEGGDLTINADNLKVLQGGRIFNLAGTEATGKGGDLTIDADNIILSGIHTSIATVETQGAGNAGDLTITSGKLEVRNGAEITSSTYAQGNGGNMFIESNEIILTNDEIALSDIEALKEFAPLVLTKEEIALSEFGRLKEFAPIILGTGIHAPSGLGDDTGNSGNVTIKSDNLIASNGASITNNNHGQVKSGKLFVESNEILLTNDPDVGENLTGILAILGSSNTGDSDGLTVKAHNLIVQNGASINTTNLGAGFSGKLVLDARSIILSGKGEGEGTDITGIISEALGVGRLGEVSVTAENLKIQNGASISARTAGAADGGDISIAANKIEMHNNADISASTQSSGSAGNIMIEAENIALSGKGTEISSEAEAQPSNKNRSGLGAAGDIAITVSDMNVRDGASISTSDFDISSNSNVGKSGNIVISLNDTLRLENTGIISTLTKKANAGNITINNGNILWLRDSSIVTSVQNDKGNGGNIFISTPIVALDNSSIIAQAKNGQGGNITITGFLFQSPSSEVNASSELGIDGNINLKPDTNISGSLAVLPDTFLNASQQMSERCFARSGNGLSSFVVKGRGGSPLSPGDLAPSNFLDYLQTEGNSPQDQESMDHHSLDNNRNSLYSGQGKSHQFASMSFDCTP